MNLTRDQLLEIYRRRTEVEPEIAIPASSAPHRRKQPRVTNNPLSWPSCDRPLTPAETAYLVPELPEEEQSTLTPP